MKFESQEFNLPLTVAGGMSFPVSKLFLLSADLKHFPSESKTRFGTGVEFSAVSLFSLRAGYLHSAVSKDINNLTGLGFRLGLKLWSTTRIA